MPRPVDGLHSVGAPNGTSPEPTPTPPNNCSIPFSDAPGLLERLISGAARGNIPFTITISFNAPADCLRGSPARSDRSEAAMADSSPSDTSSSAPSKPDRLNELSVDAELLLDVLVAARKQAEKNRSPEDAWLSKCGWLHALGSDHHRKDALTRIGELMEAGLAVDRIHGPAGKLRQYRATDEGMNRVEARCRRR